MPEDMFIKTFVGRENELRQIFSHINFNLIPSAAPGNRKNLLIKSERGIGKTSIFLAVKYKLKAEWVGMLKKIIPVFFNEQEDFNTAEKLILRVFEIILDEGGLMVSESLSHPEQWRKAYRQVKSNIAKCLDVLKEKLDREDKKLVLFIENFDSLAHRFLRKKGVKKTGKLSSQEIFTRLVKDPDILLICSAIEDPETPYDYGEESFKTYELKPVGDFYELVIQRARYDNNLFLLSNKEKLKNKIKAFEYLTGGNTRLMVHLYECMVEKDIGKLEFMLNDMINKSTPLFEWILEKFVDYESREILNALARRGGNATIKEIAEDTFNSENSVRTLLNKLRKKRFVQKINEKREKSDIYIMIPMMFFIWYQKSVLQRKDIILDFFIHFVDLFFDPTELADRKRIDHVQHLKDEKAETFAPYFSYVKKYIEAGKFPLKSYEEKREVEPLETDAENEKMIYEVVRARKDDTILQTRIHKALTLKAENKLADAANLSRIVARGYLILAEETNQSFYNQAEENIRRAIEIYQSLKTEPLETARCLLMLVEILSDTERKEEMKLFAQTIIRIGRKDKNPKFNTYLGYAYKYLGFAETEAEKKLELYNQSLNYFQKDEKEEEQIIIILVNIGLIYKTENKYEKALEYLEKALELSKKPGYSIPLNAIIFFISDVYEDAEDFRGGVKRVGEILEHLEAGQYEDIYLQGIYNRMAFFLKQNAEFLEAEKYLLKSIDLAKRKKDPWIIGILSNLIRVYSSLNKQEKVRERLNEIEKEIEKILNESDELMDESELLLLVAADFLEFGYIDRAISIQQKLYQKYKSLKNLTGQAAVLNNIGIIYLTKGDFTRAEENFQKAMEISKADNSEELLLSAKINYGSLLMNQNNIDEAINILESIERKAIIHEKELYRMIKDRLFYSYIQKCSELYTGNEIDSALIYLRKGLKCIEYLSVGDFIVGFYFDFTLSLIKQSGKKVYPFFKEVDLHLSAYYDDQEKGDYIKIFKYVVELVKGKDFNKLTKDLEPAQRNLLELINKMLNEDPVLEKVEEFIENEELDKAIELLRSSLKENERDIKRLKKLGELYKMSSQKGKYFRTLERILDFHQDDKETSINLAEYYESEGKIDEAEKILTSLLKKNPNDDFVLIQLGLLEKKRGNKKNAIKYLKEVGAYSSNEKAKAMATLLLTILYLIDNSNQALLEAERSLETINVDKFRDLVDTSIYYFLKIVLFILTQKENRAKDILKTLIFVIRDIDAISDTGISDPELRKLLRKKLNPHDFEFLYYLELMTTNEVPISTFIKKYGDSIDSKLVEEINNNISTSASSIFQRIIDENITEIDKIVTICGSRLNFESLLYIIKKEFPGLTEENQGLIISLFAQIIDKLPQAYKWLVLDFCGQHFINLNPTHQATLVNSCLKLLEEKKATLYFLREAQSFLNTAKNTMDEPLKAKIEKALINIDLNDEESK